MTFASYFNYPGALGDGPAVPSVEFLADLDSDGWTRLLRYCVMLRLNAGEVALPAGSSDRSLYLVAGGRLETVTPDGDWTALAEGAVFGELTFLDGLPEADEVRAATEAEVFRLSFEAFEVMSAREPVLARRVLLELGRLLAARIRAGRAIR